MKKQILRMILAIVMAVELLTGLAMTARAKDAISYIDANCDEQTAAATKVISLNTDITLTAGWY